MSRTRRLLVLVVAWVAPVAWIATALLAGPSDGTTITTSVSGLGGDRWSDTPRVVRTLGDTPLETGDVVLAVDGRTPGDWTRTRDAPERHVGDVVVYDVRRARAGGLSLDLSIPVPLTRYPVGAALASNPASVAVAVLVLVAGSFAYWRRPTAAAPAALLAATSLGPAALTAHPLGLGVVDLAGGRGLWPHLGGQALTALASGCVLVAALTLTAAPELGVARRGRLAAGVGLLVPVSGWGLSLVAQRDRVGAGGPSAWQAWGTVLAPAVLVTLPAILLALAVGYARAARRPDRQAARLALVGVGGGAAAYLLLGVLAAWVAGSPLIPWSLLLLVVLPVAAGCVAVAAAGYRLDEIEPAVRRVAAQLGVAALVGTAFVLSVGAVEVTSDVATGSMLAGGLLALLLLPVAVALQRAARRVARGDRELPRRVVSELRRLDPTSAPEGALQEVLDLLARRLRLSHASVELFATPTSDPVVASTGTPSGVPVDVDLAVGGTILGRLRLEADLSRDPFGPGDRRLLEDVGSQVGALVQAVVVNRELQLSRQRLVATREEERRRLRRDLHDGLGPSLASLAMRLEVAQGLIAQDPAGAAEMVGRLSDEAREEIAEVRRLVDGLRPPALDQLGLVSALRQRADELNSGRRVDGPPVTRPDGTGPAAAVVLDAGADVEPLPAAVEVAAYRIVLEAVTNARRHSGADVCRVTLCREPGVLRLRVSDSGAGLAEERPAGVGLFSMRERAEELGGTCTVTSTPGAGTTVEVELPVPDEE